MSTFPKTPDTVGPLARRFEADGTLQVVGGNTPFLLDDKDAVWFIASGKVEVFAVAREEAQAKGPRQHYFTAEAGDILMGMDLDTYGEGMGLLAVGVVGTRVFKLPLASFKELAPQAEFASSSVAAIERWVAGLSIGVSRTVVPKPRADVLIDAGESVVVEDGQRCRPRQHVLWFRHHQGASLFLGMEDLADLPERGAFPVAQEAWLQALGKSRIEAVTTAEILAHDGALWSGLLSLQAVVFKCEFFNARFATVDELNRLRDKALRDQRASEAALQAIADVLGEGPQVQSPVDTQDALLASVTAVGRHLGIDITAPPPSKSNGETATDPLQDIARASRVRMRMVLLKDEWWRADGGPFLAYWETNKQPLALIPTSPGSYEIYDPVPGKRSPVTAEIAQKMLPQAWTLYRPFGDRKLSMPLDLLRFAAESCKGEFRLPIVVGIGAGILGMATPFFMGMLVDEVIPEASRHQLVQISIILAVTGIVTALFDTVRSLSLLRIEAKMSAVVQPAMWDRVLSLPVAFFRRYSSGELAQRAMGIDAIRRVLSGVTMSALMNALFSVFNYALLFWYSWKLALVATGITLVAVLVSVFAAWRKLAVQREMMEVEGKISGLVLQLLVGISKLRVAGAERRAFSQWAHEFSKQKAFGLRAGKVDSMLAVFNAAFPVISSLTIFYAVMRVAKEALNDGGPPFSPGDFIAFNSSFGIFLSEILQMTAALMSALVVIPVFERAKPILTETPEVDTTKLDPGAMSGKIEVDRVTFRYHPDSPAILDDVTVRIEAGEFVAIVGPSGSGKSTLLRMLLGLEVPQTGGIYYDGRDVQLLDVQKLRRKIGVVTQNAAIRAGSILANIIGSLPLSIEDAWAAARMAGLDDDIKAMPMGMNTMLTQGGQTLSGGQRQRLMIARAIVTRPRILFFDEATSALDNRTQAIVSRSLKDLQATRVVIAHRLTTIMQADRIYVLRDGKLVQTGTYQDLAGQPGLFQDLIKRQVA